MPSHVQHQFAGKKEGDALTGWLNHERGKLSQKTILELLQYLKQLEDAGLAEDQDIKALHDRKFMEAVHRKVTVSKNDLRISPYYARIARGLDRTLSRCLMRPRLLSDAGGLEFGWHYNNAKARGAHLLLIVAQMGFLAKIKQCGNDECRSWFFAKFPHENVCSPRCGNHVRQSGEERNAKRRAWYQRRKILKNTTKIRMRV